MTRWIFFLITFVVGLAAGLFYGWVINPVQYKDTSPDALRSDYRCDYVLMIAEVNHTNHDLNLAAQQLAMLGSQPPAQIANQALQYAIQVGYPENNTQLLRELTTALQNWQSGSGGSP